MGKRWHYCGDVNLENGGYFWREPDDTGKADYVEAVEVTPCSDAGGPSNLFWITAGSIPLIADREKAALDCCGWADRMPQATRAQRRFMQVDAHKCYSGVEADAYGNRVVQLGARREPARDCELVDPDTILRANASLKNYVRKNFLR